MKIKELKEMLNQTDEMDEFEVFVAPTIEIKQQTLDGNEPTRIRHTASIFERYRVTTLQQMGVGPKLDGEHFDRLMVIDFDSSINFGVKRSEESETNEFVN